VTCHYTDERVTDLEPHTAGYDTVSLVTDDKWNQARGSIDRHIAAFNQSHPESESKKEAL
jgi:hypothetical protein